jgi:hypothetical protein
MSPSYVKQIKKESINIGNGIKIKRKKTHLMDQMRTHNMDIDAGLEQLESRQ